MPLLGKNVHGRRAKFVPLIVGRVDQYQSPLGGGLLLANVPWKLNQLTRRTNETRTAPHPTSYGFYISKSSSFGGVGSIYGSGKGAAFRHDAYIPH